MTEFDSLLALPEDLPRIHALTAHDRIAPCLQIVEQLRQARQAHPEFAQRTTLLKRWQAQRFTRTYADVLQDPSMGPAAKFFLTELYSDKEYSERDAQFARIAGTLERMFPQAVVHTATFLAQLHALSETLDANMARVWMHHAQHLPQTLDEVAYRQLWQALMQVEGYAQGREAQIQAAQELGQQLQRHTRLPGLRLMLRMMRAPASAAGLHQLQQFLECGFDTFAQLGKAGQVAPFLQIIQSREQDWLVRMNKV
ncbi:MAG: FFLEELY motif protein [Brachymonas sp.]